MFTFSSFNLDRQPFLNSLPLGIGQICWIHDRVILEFAPQNYLTDSSFRETLNNLLGVWQQSILLENTGNDFKIKPLPTVAQWTSVQGLLVDDVDRDGNLDVLAVGNAYDTESVAGQYDALTGLLLKGDGRGRFRPLLFPQSGFLADGNCKSIVQVKGKKNPLYVVSANNAPLLVFQPRKR